MRMPLIASVILLLDQLTKQLVLTWASMPIWLVPEKIGFELSHNPGVAFSLPITGVWALGLSAAIILLLTLYFARSVDRNPWSNWTFGLIIGGALGNLVDRIWLGSVIDYIRIYSYPTFNLADIAITLGFLLFIMRFDRITTKRFSLF